MVGTLRKLVWVFEFWNEMLVSNVRCKKNLLKRSSFRKFLLEFWEERGEKLMTCHLFLDNFSWNFVTFGLFSKVKSFEMNFVSRQLKYHTFEIMEFCLSESCLFAKDVLLQKFDCVFVLAIRGSLHMTKNVVSLFFVVWFCVSITVTESFEKFPLKKSWRCRKHVFVFEIVSLKGLNKSWSNHSFPFECWVENLFAIMEKVWKLFHFGSWLLSQVSRKVKFAHL